jgi:hypothetical protein
MDSRAAQRRQPGRAEIEIKFKSFNVKTSSREGRA